MNTKIKRQIAFTLGMGIVTTGVISFVLIAINLGFSKEFTVAWLRSWGIAYVIVIPIILAIGPRLTSLCDRLIH